MIKYRVGDGVMYLGKKQGSVGMRIFCVKKDADVFDRLADAQKAFAEEGFLAGGVESFSVCDICAHETNAGENA